MLAQLIVPLPMSALRNNLFLILCLCGGASTGLAQQAPIAPLAPATPVVAPPVPDLGAKIETKRPAASPPTATTPSQNRPVIPDPVIIINGLYLTGMSGLGIIKPQQIDKLDIYRQGQGPLQWRSLTAPGIISITLKAKPRVKLKAKSLAAIKRKLGLHGPVQFELNGAPIEDESLRIVTAAVAALDVTDAASGTTDKTVVNIRLVPSKVRPSTPIEHPPGTIMIRGLAQQ